MVANNAILNAFRGRYNINILRMWTRSFAWNNRSKPDKSIKYDSIVKSAYVILFIWMLKNKK